MANRTPESEWGNLFNFAGAGLVHVNRFAEFLVSLDNPTLFEAIAAYLIAFGTHSNRPSAANVPLNAIYFETDTGNGYQNQAGTWTLICVSSGSGLISDVQVNGVSVTDPTTLNFVDGTDIAVTNPSAGDINVAYTGGGGSGGLVLAGGTELSANADQIDVTGLDGDTDQFYFAMYQLLLNGGSNNIDLQPNSSSSNLRYVANYGTGQLSGSGGQLITGQGTDFVVTGFINCLVSRTRHSNNFVRTYAGQIANAVGDNSAAGCTNFTISESGTGSNLTSLRLHSNQSNGLKAGSTFYVWKPPLT